MENGDNSFEQTGKELDLAYDALNKAKESYELLKQQYEPHVKVLEERVVELKDLAGNQNKALARLRRDLTRANRNLIEARRDAYKRYIEFASKVKAGGIHVSIDHNYRVGEGSKKFYSFSDYSDEEIKGKDITTYFEDRGAVKNFLADEELETAEAVFLCKENPEKPKKLRKIPVRLTKEKILFYKSEIPEEQSPAIAYHVTLRVIHPQRESVAKMLDSAWQSVSSARKSLADRIRNYRKRQREREAEEPEEEVFEETEEDLMP